MYSDKRCPCITELPNTPQGMMMNLRDTGLTQVTELQATS